MRIDSLHLYQAIIIAISAIMIVQGFNKFIKGKSGQTFYKFALRLFVWGGMGTITLYPSISYKIARFIGIEGNVNAVILTGFILVFLMIFRLLSAIERLEQQITEVTRKDAIKELHNKEQNSLSST